MKLVVSVLVIFLVMSIACAAPISEKPPTAIQPSTPAQPAPSSTPLLPSPTLPASWFDVKQYTGILSPDCKPPVTDLEGMPLLAIKLTVDVAKLIGNLDHTLWSNIGGGCGYGLTDGDHKPFWELNRSTGIFRFTRNWGVLSDGAGLGQGEVRFKQLLQTGNLSVHPSTKQPLSIAGYYMGCQIYSEDDKGNPVYNFWHLDHLLDTTLSGGMKPIVQFNEMPDILAGGEKIRCAQGGLINTPKDFNKWRDLCYSIVKHCIERYGAEEVHSWYFVMWNEPDLPAYFVQDSNSITNYLKMYDYCADGVKAADPEVKIGGAELASDTWLKPFLDHCANGNNYANGKTGAPLDILTWHQYGMVDRMLSYNDKVMQLLQQYPRFKGIPIMQTEWGNNLGVIEQGKWVRNVNTDDQYTNYESAHICKYVAGLLQDSRSRSPSFFRLGLLIRTSDYRYHSFVYGEHFIPMPVLNAYILLAKMGNDQIELTDSMFKNNVHGFAARTSNGVQVLLYNFDEKDTKSEGKTVEVALTVKNISDTLSNMKRYQIDNQNSNAWGKYPINKPITSMDQLIQMEKDSRLKIVEQTNTLVVKDSNCTFRLSMPANSVTLIVLGDEASPRQFTPSPHIAKVLQEEAEYYAAQILLDRGELAGARAAFEQLVTNSFAKTSSSGIANPYSFWGQKALYKVRDIAIKQGNHAVADQARVRLLTTTLTDVERFVLLNERQRYLEAAGKKREAEAVTEILKTVQARLEYIANWAKWESLP